MKFYFKMEKIDSISIVDQKGNHIPLLIFTKRAVVSFPGTMTKYTLGKMSCVLIETTDHETIYFNYDGDMVKGGMRRVEVLKIIECINCTVTDKPQNFPLRRQIIADWKKELRKKALVIRAKKNYIEPEPKKFDCLYFDVNGDCPSCEAGLVWDDLTQSHMSPEILNSP